VAVPAPKKTGVISSVPTFRWLGVAGVVVEAGGQTLAVDPYLTRASLLQVAFARLRPRRDRVVAALPRCNHVLITHAHFDHLLDVPTVARTTGARVWGSPNACALLTASGVPFPQIRGLSVGDELALGPFEVTVLPAQHLRLGPRPPLVGPVAPDRPPPWRAFDYRMDEVYSFLIRVAGVRLLLWSGEMLAPVPAADVLALNALTVTGAEVIAAARPRALVPLHWDDFFRSGHRPLRPMLTPSLRRFDLAALRRTVARVSPGTRMWQPVPGRPYPLAPTTWGSRGGAG
jgi:hypothetical protein